MPFTIGQKNVFSGADGCKCQVLQNNRISETESLYHSCFVVLKLIHERKSRSLRPTLFFTEIKQADVFNLLRNLNSFYEQNQTPFLHKHSRSGSRSISLRREICLSFYPYKAASLQETEPAQPKGQ